MAADRPFEPDELARHRDFLCRLARGLLGDAARADDVVQQAFVLALEHPPRDAGALATWLGRVVRRLSANERRGRLRAHDHERRSARPAMDDSQAEAAAQLDAQQLVLAAVRALDEPYRTTIWLRYYEDLAPGAIATRHTLPVKTVKTRLARGLDRLRAELARGRGGEPWVWSAVLAPLARRAPRAGVIGSLGGALMAKKLLAAAVVLGLLWLGWMARQRPATLAVGEPVAESDGELAAPLTATERAAPEPQRELVPAVAPAPTPASDVRDASALATLLVTVRHAALEPAPGIGLALWPVEAPQPDLALREVETDAAGTVRFEELVAGPYRLQADRGAAQSVVLAPGEARELEVVLERGVDVAGIVLDPDGAPLAGAELRLQRRTPALSAACIVGRSGADGTFTLRALDPQDALAAFAPGFAPSFVHWLQRHDWPASDPRVRLTLSVRLRGAAARGRVLDPEGRAVAGARVAVGERGPCETRNDAGGSELLPGVRYLVTDDLGRFALDSLEPGPQPVFVLAAGFALAERDVVVTPEHVQEVEIRLTIGAELRGRASLAAGSPASGARIGLSQLGDARSADLPFRMPSTRCAADGTYLLAPIPIADVALVASSADRRAAARTGFTPLEGERLAWDPVLSRAEVITGRVQDESGQPLARWSIQAQSPGCGMFTIASDAEGRFAFHPVVATPSSEAEWTFRLVNGGLQDSVEHVHPGDEIVLTGHAGAESVGRIEGRFVDAAGLVPPGARVLAVCLPDASGPGSVFLEPVPVVDGRIAIEGLAPGRHRLVLMLLDGTEELARTDWIEVEAGRTSDAGTIVTEAPGTLVVDLVLAGKASEGLELVALDSENEHPLVRAGSEWRARLRPGTYRLHSALVGLTLPPGPLEITGDRETRIALSIEPGVRCDVHIRVPPGAEWERIELTVEAAGRPPLATTIPRPASTCSFWLARGDHVLDARTDGGLSATARIRVDDLGDSPADVALEFR